MDRQAAYLQHVRARYPELEIQTVDFQPREGQFNDILVINGNLVFRFPRRQRTANNLIIEKAILARIQRGVPLPVPRPVYSSVNTTTVGEVFVGYHRIPGRSLKIEIYRQIRERYIRRYLAVQLAGFMRALHNFPAEYFGIDLPHYDTLPYWQEMYAGIEQHLFAHMRPDAREQVTAHFNLRFNQPDLFVFEPCLVHGDLGPYNIIYDEPRSRIGGIIDFSEAGIGDPAMDLASVSLFGDEFVDYMLPVYPQLAEMRQRAAWYRGTFALQEALSGTLDGDETAFRNGMAGYI